MAEQATTTDQIVNQEELRQMVEVIVGRLSKEADQRVSKRDIIEQRWLDDESQYHGRYTAKLVSQLESEGKSSLYINSTRPKTNAMSSRLYDMLFPTDDKNWGIKPTPVPELIVEAEQAAMASAQAELRVTEDPQNETLIQQADEARQHSAQIEATMDEAKKRARSMETEIDDHLRESHYNSQSRDVIDDACKLGTGIIKGPVIGERSRQSWQQEETMVDNDGEPHAVQDFALKNIEDPRPVYWRVDPWNFFPDMDATRIEDSEGDFERHLMNAKQLRKLAREPGFDQDAIRRLLVHGSKDSMPTYVSELRSITGADDKSLNDRFHVWEYRGQLSLEDMQTIAQLVKMVGSEQMQEKAEGMLQDLGEYDFDPLTEIDVVIWFCDNELLKFGLHHLDSGDSVYSVFCLEKDPSSIFGFGIPYIIRDPQKAMASAWRALMDNAGLAAGPQLVVNENVIEPTDGDWKLRPRKTWRMKKGAPKGEEPFKIINIDSNITDLTALIELCKTNVDEETNLPMIAQGEQGTDVTKTATGMSLLMNSANVIFKRIVKNWDDDMTTPSLRRIYHFLMQFSPKQHIKGDYEVDARGTSVLLVREIQSANIMLFLTNFSGHPILGKFLKEEGVRGLRRLAQTMMIPADDLVKSDDEIRQDEADEARKPTPVDPEMEIAALNANLKRDEMAHNRYLAEMQRDTEMLKLAQTSNISLDKIEAQLQDAREARAARLAEKREEAQSKERIVATETAMAQKLGVGGGGHV